MMFFLTEESDVVCAHRGLVRLKPTQKLVRIDARTVLVDDDPVGRDIDRCPVHGPMLKACGKTIKVIVGYSAFIRIDGRRVVLDNLAGMTNGTPPGNTFLVRDPRQKLVSGSS